MDPGRLLPRPGARDRRIPRTGLLAGADLPRIAGPAREGRIVARAIPACQPVQDAGARRFETHREKPSPQRPDTAGAAAPQFGGR